MSIAARAPRGALSPDLFDRSPEAIAAHLEDAAHYPGGHPEAYPDGLKNFMLRVYSYIAGESKTMEFSTFADGHDELAICEAVLASARSKAWQPVKY